LFGLTTRRNRMPTYAFQCDCGETIEEFVPMAKQHQTKLCPNCGKRAKRSFKRAAMNASSGMKRSAIAGCGFGQEEQGNRDLAKRNINAYYEKGSGDLVANSRKDFLAAVGARGMHSNTDAPIGRVMAASR